MHGGMLFDRIVEKEEYSEAEAKKVIRGVRQSNNLSGHLELLILALEVVRGLEIFAFQRNCAS